MSLAEKKPREESNSPVFFLKISTFFCYSLVTYRLLCVFSITISIFFCCCHKLSTFFCSIYQKVELLQFFLSKYCILSSYRIFCGFSNLKEAACPAVTAFTYKQYQIRCANTARELSKLLADTLMELLRL